jgi:hypothetical protein
VSEVLGALGNTEGKIKSRLFEIASYFYEINHTTIVENGKVVRMIKLNSLNTILPCFSFKEEKTYENGVYNLVKKQPKSKQLSFIDTMFYE